MWSAEDGVYIGRVAEIDSLSAHGRTPEAALRRIIGVMRDVIEELESSGERVPEPITTRVYSGKLVVRLPASLHRRLALEAARDGVSLNQLINLKLAS